MKLAYLAGIAVTLGVAAYTSYDLYARTGQELLWGWRPLILMVSIWLSLILASLAAADRPRTRRWIAWSSLSGLLLAVAFPPSPMVPLIFIGLVPLLMLEKEISRLRGVSRWSIFKYAFNAFIIWNMCTTWWILNTSFMPGVAANITNAALMAATFTLYHHFRHNLAPRLQVLLFIAVWVAFEYVHLFWDISWPWLHLGHTFAQYPSWVQWYEYTGIFGGTVWVLLVNYLISLAHDTWRRTGELASGPKWAIGLLILLPVALGVLRFFTYQVPENAERSEIVVVQPNFEPHYQKFNIPQREQLVRFLDLARSQLTDSTQYLVFPETSFGLIYLNAVEDDYRVRALRELIQEYPNLAIITGLDSYRGHDGPVDLASLRIQVRGADTLYYDRQNSAIQLAGAGDFELYFKSKLVPGAELMPFGANLPFLKPLIVALQGSVAGITTQAEREVFRASHGVAPIICYESVYGAYVGEYVKRGAEMLFVITNDGWWDDTPGHVQHMKFARLRAIEYRKPVARSANTGISCFINSRGDVLQATVYDEPVAIRGDISLDPTTTFYSNWGDVIARLCAFMAILLIILSVTRGFLKKRATD